MAESPILNTNPEHPHLPLQSAYCVLCRYPIHLGEAIAAVIGEWDSPKYSAHSLRFLFPLEDGNCEYTTVYERASVGDWQICRSADCRRCLTSKTRNEHFVYHIDCFHFVGKSTSVKALCVHDVWTIATWTHSLPGTRYPVLPDMTAGAIGYDSVLKADGSTAARVCSLPLELRSLIIGFCEWSSYWRLLSALNRCHILQPLLESSVEVDILSLTSLQSWDRDRGLIAGVLKKDALIRIELDGFGISNVEFLDTYPLPQRIHSKNKWFVVDEAIKFTDARVEIKGPFLRIHVLPSFQLWDTSTPPSPALTWHSDWASDARARCISLEGITGLTVFCLKGAVRWIHPHFSQGFRFPFPHDSSPPVPQEALGSVESHSFAAIFFPLAEGERIQEIWVRNSGYINYGKSSVPDALAMVTTTGRFQLFGKYVCPRREEVSFNRLSHRAAATQILLPDLVFPPSRVDRFSVASSSLDYSDTRAPDCLLKSQGFSLTSKFGYSSVANFQNVSKTWLFRPKVPASTPKQDRPCNGMMLEYSDGTLASLGVCRRAPNITVEFRARPLSIHYKISRRCGAVAVELDMSRRGSEDDLGNFSSWDTIDADSGREIRWWFDDVRTIWITCSS